MHFVTVLTLGDWLLFIILALVAAFFLLLFVAQLYEKLRKKIAHFLSGSWWSGVEKK